jgi:hypothetical protein
MTIVALLLAAAAIALAARTGLRLLAVQRTARDSADALRYSGLRLIELQSVQAQQLRLADAQRLAETAIDTGTDVARTIHRSIASVPFGVLEALPVTRDVSKVVRQTHDVIADAVYGSIKGVNRGLGQLTRGLLSTPGDVSKKPTDSQD